MPTQQERLEAPATVRVDAKVRLAPPAVPPACLRREATSVLMWQKATKTRLLHTRLLRLAQPLAVRHQIFVISITF